MSNRTEIDGIKLPDLPAIIDRQRRDRQRQEDQRPQPQPSVYDIHREGYEWWRREQERQRDRSGDGTGRGVTTIIIGGDDDED